MDTFVDWSAEVVVLDISASEGVGAGVAGFEV